VIEIDKRIGGPELLAQFFSRNNFSFMLKKSDKYSKGLFLKLDLDTVLAQFATTYVNFKDSKPNGPWLIGVPHSQLPPQEFTTLKAVRNVRKSLINGVTGKVSSPVVGDHVWCKKKRKSKFSPCRWCCGALAVPRGAPSPREDPREPGRIARTPSADVPTRGLYLSGKWFYRARLDAERGDCQVSVTLTHSEVIRVRDRPNIPKSCTASDAEVNPACLVA